MDYKFFIRVAFGIWTFIIIVFSVIPLMPLFENMDNLLCLKKFDYWALIIHFAAYFIMTLLFYYSYERTKMHFVLLYALVVFIFSLVLEFVQLYLPHRNFQISDIVANASGIFCFIFIWYLSQLSKQSKKLSMIHQI